MARKNLSGIRILRDPWKRDWYHVWVFGEHVANGSRAWCRRRGREVARLKQEGRW